MEEQGMKILVTATNYSQYCQAGKRILEQAGCEIVENQMEDRIKHQS